MGPRLHRRLLRTPVAIPGIIGWGCPRNLSARDCDGAWAFARCGGGTAWRRNRARTSLMAMRAPAANDRFAREPDNELYDYGCDLVQAASAIRRASEAPEAARAVPAVLGCIEAALGELFWASAALEETSARPVREQARRCTDSRTGRITERMHRGFANLQHALADAERASAAARSLAGRALQAAGAVSTDRRR
jgi:hypothetical protein